MQSNTITTKALTAWILTTLRESFWAPASVFVIYQLGLATHIYDKFPYLDIPTHFLGGVSITYLYRSAIRNSQGFVGTVPYSVQVLLALTCTGTTTVLWELYEYFADRFLGAHMVRGLEDTLVDMFLGLSGAAILSLLYRRE